jgi:hypothetical protein
LQSGGGGGGRSAARLSPAPPAGRRAAVASLRFGLRGTGGPVQRIVNPARSCGYSAARSRSP